MAAERGPVIHQAISKTSRQIRLLRILSESPIGDLECSLGVYDIDTAPSYTAISYTWGPVAPVRTLTINKASISVRKNCHTALKHASLHSQVLAKYLWIDAICIDQENLLEKNHQVSLMAAIYAKAESVLVSLGSSYPNVWPEVIQRTLSEQRWTEHEALCGELLQISQATYWTRLWIVQEYLIAPYSRLYIATGDTLVEESKLYDLLKAIERCQNKPKIKHNRELFGLQTVWTEILNGSMALMCSDRHNNLGVSASALEGQPLERLLKIYGSHGCADIRDKVFGLLHLVTWPNFDTKMRADYTKSIFEVGVDCVRCGVPPALAYTALHLGWDDADMQKETQFSSEDTLQTGASIPKDHLSAYLSTILYSIRTRNGYTKRSYRNLNVVHIQPCSEVLQLRWILKRKEENVGSQDDGCSLSTSIYADEGAARGVIVATLGPSSDLEMLSVDALWVPWMPFGIHALVHDSREPPMYNLVERDELPLRMDLARVIRTESSVTPEEAQSLGTTKWFERHLRSRSHPGIPDSCGLVLRGTDQTLYLVIGRAKKVPTCAILCDSWLDQPEFKYEQSHFCHIVQARDFYRATAHPDIRFELPIYMDPEDALVAICQDYERLRSSREKTVCQNLIPDSPGTPLTDLRSVGGVWAGSRVTRLMFQ